MTCVVFGASGLIGRHLLPRLAEQGVEVTAVSRTARDDGSVDWLRGRLPDTVPTLPAGITAIICLGPLDHFSHWLEQAALDGSPRVVAMSSMSAESKRDSPEPAERELAARLRQAEQRLMARCDALGSTCTVLRATLIYGGPEGSLERLAARARRWHAFPLLRGRGLRQPVHADDLALAVLAALQAPGGSGVVEVGGGERLSASAMYTRTRRQWAPRTLGIPVPGRVCALLTAAKGNGRGMAQRLGRDLVADNARLHTELGVQPRRFLVEPDADVT